MSSAGLLRFGLAVGWFVVCVSTPGLHMLMAAARPVHSIVIEALMPGFAVQSLRVEPVAAHLKLRLALRNESHVVVQGRALAPGFQFSAETPARQTLLLVALLGACALLTVRGPVPRAWASAALAAVVSIGLLLLWPPVVLSGSIWALVSPGQSAALSVEALAIWSARSALHGGGLVLVALLAWALITRHRQPR